eukprot:CAMPEP_0203753482 /NCGR_PEP_ID=MMETSP0098-20131031/7242_1 /ASSEMBLY_ACC=CAM_ASM_000208 /TAXON_ID=96639 /ORGANISM=" , Strain NY0313808BC1" /LENGTH=481 /DNA_ID=CAMNT_0050644101 /DNA_START=324 /DNA_END=1766 /DNA_ORIENTATION=+
MVEYACAQLQSETLGAFVLKEWDSEVMSGPGNLRERIEIATVFDGIVESKRQIDALLEQEYYFNLVLGKLANRKSKQSIARLGLSLEYKCQICLAAFLGSVDQKTKIRDHEKLEETIHSCFRNVKTLSKNKFAKRVKNVGFGSFSCDTEESCKAQLELLCGLFSRSDPDREEMLAEYLKNRSWQVFVQEIRDRFIRGQVYAYGEPKLLTYVRSDLETRGQKKNPRSPKKRSTPGKSPVATPKKNAESSDTEDDDLGKQLGTGTRKKRKEPMDRKKTRVTSKSKSKRTKPASESSSSDEESEAGVPATDVDTISEASTDTSTQRRNRHKKSPLRTPQSSKKPRRLESRPASTGGRRSQTQLSGLLSGRVRDKRRISLDPKTWSVPKKQSGRDDDSTALETNAQAQSAGNKSTRTQKHDETSEASTQPKKRRVVTPWTVIETQALLDGVNEHGIGEWAKILHFNKSKFNPVRTSVSLKDKYRN